MHMFSHTGGKDDHDAKESMLTGKFSERDLRLFQDTELIFS